MKPQGSLLIQSTDGSYTIQTNQNESYHSRQGAIGESLYVYIERGLKYIGQRGGSKPIKVLEVGLGTGLNALLSAIYAYSNQIQVEYQALEPYPISSSLLQSLIQLSKNPHKELYRKIMKSPWNKTMELGFFSIKKIKKKIENFQTDQKYDLIYFDAFSYVYQPEIWSSQVANKLYTLMSESAVLTSYSVQGRFIRQLRRAGLYPSKLEGAVGKRNCLRAFKWPLG